MKNKILLTVLSLIISLVFLGSSCGPKPPEPSEDLLPIPLSVTDIDRNKYNVKRFGKMLWMTENLRVTRYDTESPHYGDTIAVATYQHAVNTDKPYYINAQNFEEAPYTDNLTEEIRNSLGLLYNWSAAAGVEQNSNTVKDSIQGICPNGWRLPRVKDLDSLYKYLDDKETAGTQLKSLYGWHTLTGSGTNESGLNCYPAGTAANSFVSLMGQMSLFWTSTGQIGNTIRVGALILSYDQENAETVYVNKLQANSIRCVMDITNKYKQ